MDIEDLRLAVYRSFADHGTGPTVAQLAASFGCGAEDVGEGLAALANARHLALDAGGSIAMAHPFSAVPLGFAVMGATTLWWGGCAWDSFALPHLIPHEGPMLVSTRCPACSRPHAWDVGTEAPPEGDQVAHFLIPARHIWDDVVHTCAHQRRGHLPRAKRVGGFLRRGLRRGLAGGIGQRARLRDGPRHPVAARRALV